MLSCTMGVWLPVLGVIISQALKVLIYTYVAAEMLYLYGCTVRLENFALHNQD